MTRLARRLGFTRPELPSPTAPLSFVADLPDPQWTDCERCIARGRMTLRRAGEPEVAASEHLALTNGPDLRLPMARGGRSASATFLFTDQLDFLFPAATGIALWTIAAGDRAAPAPASQEPGRPRGVGGPGSCRRGSIRSLAAAGPGQPGVSTSVRGGRRQVGPSPPRIRVKWERHVLVDHLPALVGLLEHPGAW
jgi:hypothetical protein